MEVALVTEAKHEHEVITLACWERTYASLLEVDVHAVGRIERSTGHRPSSALPPSVQS